jgi:hypothetical protein
MRKLKLLIKMKIIDVLLQQNQLKYNNYFDYL